MPPLEGIFVPLDLRQCIMSCCTAFLHGMADQCSLGNGASRVMLSVLNISIVLFFLCFFLFSVGVWCL